MSLPSRSDKALAAVGEARSGDTPAAPTQQSPEAAVTPSSMNTNSAEMAQNPAQALANPSNPSAVTSSTPPPASTTLATGITGTSNVNANPRPLPIRCAEASRSPAHSGLAECFSAATTTAENIGAASSVADGGPSGQKTNDEVTKKKKKASRRQRRGSVHRPYQFDVLDDYTSYWNARNRPRTPPGFPSRVLVSPDPDHSGVFRRESVDRFARHYLRDFGEDIGSYSSSPALSPTIERRNSPPQASSSAAIPSSNASKGSQPSSSSATIRRNDPPPTSSSPIVRRPASSASGASFGNAARWFLGQMEQVPTSVDVEEEERKSESDLFEALMELSESEMPAASNPTIPDATMNSAVFPSQPRTSTTSSPSATSAIRGSVSGLESSSNSANKSSPTLPTRQASMKVDEEAKVKEELTQISASNSPSHETVERSDEAEVIGQPESAGEADLAEVSEADVESFVFDSIVEGSEPAGDYMFAIAPHLKRRCEDLLKQVAAARAGKLPRSSAASPPRQPHFVTDPSLLAKCRKLSKAVAAAWAKRRGLPPPADSDDSCLPSSSADTQPRMPLKRKPSVATMRLEEKCRKHLDALAAARTRSRLPPSQREVESKRSRINPVEEPVSRALIGHVAIERPEAAAGNEVNPSAEEAVSTGATSSKTDDAQKEESGRQNSVVVDSVLPESQANVTGVSVEVAILQNSPKANGSQQNANKKKKRSKCASPNPSQIPKKKQALQQQPNQPTPSANDRSLLIVDSAVNDEEAIEAETDPSAIRVAQSVPNVMAAESPKEAEVATEQVQSPVQDQPSVSVENLANGDVNQPQNVIVSVEVPILPDSPKTNDSQQNANKKKKRSKCASPNPSQIPKKKQALQQSDQPTPSANDRNLSIEVSDVNQATMAIDEEQPTSDAEQNQPDVVTAEASREAEVAAENVRSPVQSQPSNSIEDSATGDANQPQKVGAANDETRQEEPVTVEQQVVASAANQSSHEVEAIESNANSSKKVEKVAETDKTASSKTKTTEVTPPANAMEASNSSNMSTSESVTTATESSSATVSVPIEQPNQMQMNGEFDDANPEIEQSIEKHPEIDLTAPSATDQSSREIVTVNEADSTSGNIEVTPAVESRKLSNEARISTSSSTPSEPRNASGSKEATTVDKAAKTPRSSTAAIDVPPQTGSVNASKVSNEASSSIPATTITGQMTRLGDSIQEFQELLMMRKWKQIHARDEVIPRPRRPLPAQPPASSTKELTPPANAMASNSTTMSSSEQQPPLSIAAASQPGPSTVTPLSAQSSPDQSSEFIMIPTRRSQLLTVKRLQKLKELDAQNPRPNRTPSPKKTPPRSANDESIARRRREREECEAMSSDQPSEEAPSAVQGSSNTSNVTVQDAITREAIDNTQIAGSTNGESSVENTGNADNASSVEQIPVGAVAEIVQPHEDPYMHDVPALDDYDSPSEDERSYISLTSTASSMPTTSAPSRRRRRIISDSISGDDEPPARRQRREFSLEPDAMDVDGYRWCERCYRGCRCPGIPRPHGHRDDLPPPPPPPEHHDEPVPPPANPPQPPKRRRRQNDPVFGRLQHINDIEGVDLPNAPPVVVDQEAVYEGVSLAADQQIGVLRGEHFTLALYESGVVVFQGFFEGGSTASAQMREAARQPIMLMNHPHHKIVQVAIGTNHVVMRDEAGNIFTVGRSLEGQLGVVNPRRYRQSALTPEAMHRPIMNGGRRVVITDIRVEGNTTVAITENRVEYRCGERFGPLFAAAAAPAPPPRVDNNADE